MKTEIREVDKTRTYPRDGDILYDRGPFDPFAAQNARQGSIQLYGDGTGHRKSTHRSHRVEKLDGVNCGSKVGVSLDASAL